MRVQFATPSGFLHGKAVIEHMHIKLCAMAQAGPARNHIVKGANV